ncbi:histidine phosphatase family protein [Natronohydrobacter thiooxidans]|uniref:histidine phosphatase family protein n=1 Tax=Natronohydrobacter thiooxidans TaxID=87172 RepID=UPI000AFAF03C|nr:histidine phosphatase family protein [Natronohydrobacter thiooxidans]
MARLRIIRHAPALHGGALAGRRDVAADLGDGVRLAALRAVLGDGARVVTSPALRCLQTAEALFPGVARRQDARLWEQDFGAWEGMGFDALPDLGPMSRAELAAHCPPGGESFDRLCARVWPALHEIAASGDAVIVAHAGVIRAGLALVLDSPAQGLAFEVAPLSLTELQQIGALWSVACVNWQAR